MIQDQPVVGVQQKLFRNQAHQPVFNLEYILARSDARSVRHPIDMGVHSHRHVTEGGVENHICSFPTHAW